MGLAKRARVHSRVWVVYVDHSMLVFPTRTAARDAVRLRKSANSTPVEYVVAGPYVLQTGKVPS
jgi:hypothetical protein